MSVNIGTFVSSARRAEVGDTFKLGGEGGNRLQTQDKSFKGRIVAWFRKTFTPGKVAKENRGVMEAFVASIKSDRFHYGEQFGDMAADILGDDIKSGAPLTKRKIQHVMDVLDERHELLKQLNTTTSIMMTSRAPGSEFRSTLTRIMGERGLPTDHTLYDTKDICRGIEKAIISGKQRGRPQYWPISYAQARDIVSQKITQFADRFETSMQTLTSAMSKEDPDFSAMQKTLLHSTEKVRKTEYIVGLKELRGTVRDSVRALGTEGKTDIERFRILHELSATVCAKVREIKGPGAGSDDFGAAIVDALNFALFSGEINESDMRAVMKMLGSEGGDKLRGAVNLLMDIDVKIPSDKRSVNKKVSDEMALFIYGMSETFGAHLGMSEEDTTVCRKFPMNTDVETYIPREFRIALEEMGIGAPMVEGESIHKGSFHETFKAKISESINAMYSSKTLSYDEHGLSNFILRDMEGASLTIDGVVIDHSVGSLEDGITNFREAFTGPDGYDLKGAKALTAILHQGLLGTITSTLYMAQPNDGIERPFVGNVGGQGEKTKFMVTRDPKSGDFLIRVDYSSKPDKMAVLDPEKGVEARTLDPESSSQSYVLEGRISRESIDAGEPKFELLTANYDSVFVEQ